MNELKILSLFSGIGAFEKALTRQNIAYELVNYCEIDKYASKSFSLIHNVSEDKNLGDITKVNPRELTDFDLMTWGFPCQDISIAGKQKGIIKGETRSGLYYEGLRILEEKKPKYSIIENVKALTQKKFTEQFKQILKDLEELGYTNHWKVLNAKDFGVPQNRERVFIVSIRKDLKQDFVFPQGFDNGLRLKDILQDIVDEKYYIDQAKTDKLIAQLKIKNGCATDEIEKYRRQLVINVGNTNPSGNGMNGCVYSDEGLAPTLTTNKGEGNKILQVGNIDNTGNFNNPQRGRIYSPDGISPALNTVGDGGLEPKILEDFYSNLETHKVICLNTKDENGKQPSQQARVYDTSGIMTSIMAEQNGRFNILEDKLAIENISSEYQFVKDRCKEFYYKNGYLPEMFNPYNQAEITDNVPTQTTKCNSSSSSSAVLIKDINYRIRKLTPLECFRLMGFDDEDFYILKENNISDTQIYKMAGNSIVVNVLEGIFKNMLSILGDITQANKKERDYGKR